MEFTWDKTCAARKYTFLRAHFWSPGTAYLKCTCPNVYFWCFDDVYFLDIFGAFPMHFLRKSVFFFTLLVPVSRQGVFFLRLGHLCLVQVYFFYACVEIGLARLLRVYFLTHALCIFFASAFLDGSCGNKTRIFTACVFWQHMFS